MEAVGQVVIGDHEVMHLGPEDVTTDEFIVLDTVTITKAKEASSSAAMSARSRG